MACRARATSQAYPTAPRRATRFGRRSSPLPARAALLASLSAPKAASVRTVPHRIRPPALHPLQITCCRFLFPAIRILAAKTGVLSPKPAQNPGFAARKQKSSGPGCAGRQGRDAGPIWMQGKPVGARRHNKLQHSKTGCPAEGRTPRGHNLAQNQAPSN